MPKPASAIMQSTPKPTTLTMIQIQVLRETAISTDVYESRPSRFSPAPASSGKRLSQAKPGVVLAPGIGAGLTGGLCLRIFGHGFGPVAGEVGEMPQGHVDAALG